MDESKLRPCTKTECEHYYSDGKYCIEMGCFGVFAGDNPLPGDLILSIAGGRKINPTTE